MNYQSTRQTGSHVRLTGLADAAANHAMIREASITRLFGRQPQPLP
ncbi:MAG: hypothetical protein NUV75_10715 [Gallionella sp.]|nr:hypothetical protein [Gallionella sp.]